MFCQKCGKEIPNDSKVCPYCGVRLADSIQPQPNAKPEKKKKKTGCLIAVVLVIALIAILAVIISSGDDSSEGASTTSHVNSSEEANNKGNAYKPIYEDEYIKASFMRVYDDAAVSASVEGVSYMQLHIENKSNKTLTVAFTDAAINGMSATIGSGVPVTILPGNTSEQAFILFTKNTNVKSADEINKLQFKFYLMDDDVNTVEETKLISFDVK